MTIQKEVWKMRARLALIIILSIVIGATATYSYIEGKNLYNYIVIGKALAANSTPYVSGVSASDPVGEKVFDKESGEIASSVSPQSILLKKYFGDEAKLAYAVMMAESSGDPSRIGDTHMAKYSYGLFQINQTWHPFTKDQLLDPEFNIKTAKEIRDSDGWERWTTYRTGQYRNFLN